MNYEQAMEYIHAVQWAGHKPGLTRTRTLLAALGDPHKPVSYTHLDVYKRQGDLQGGSRGRERSAAAGGEQDQVCACGGHGRGRNQIVAEMCIRDSCRSAATTTPRIGIWSLPSSTG